MLTLRVLKGLLGGRSIPFGDDAIDLGKERGAHADILAGIEKVRAKLGYVLNAETGRILCHSYPDNRLTQISLDELHRLVLGRRFRYKDDALPCPHGDGQMVGAARFFDESLNDLDLEAGIGALLNQVGIDPD